MLFFIFFSRSLAKMKSVSSWLVEVMMSLLSPRHSKWPWYMNIIDSPIPITEFMSWVLIMVVMLYSWVML